MFGNPRCSVPRQSNALSWAHREEAPDFAACDGLVRARAPRASSARSPQRTDIIAMSRDPIQVMLKHCRGTDAPRPIAVQSRWRTQKSGHLSCTNLPLCWKAALSTPNDEAISEAQKNSGATEVLGSFSEPALRYGKWADLGLPHPFGSNSGSPRR